jgi:hypothetical protein
MKNNKKKVQCSRVQHLKDSGGHHGKHREYKNDTETKYFRSQLCQGHTIFFFMPPHQELSLGRP